MSWTHKSLHIFLTNPFGGNAIYLFTAATDRRAANDLFFPTGRRFVRHKEPGAAIDAGD
jgi:hypothetical protein